MQNYVRIGRDIVVGKGFSAKHWSGPVTFSRDAIYICPNISEAALLMGFDSGAMAGGLLGAVGGALAGAAQKRKNVQESWKSCVVDLQSLPSEVLSHPEWPVKKKKRPVIVLRRDLVEKIERAGGKFLVSSGGDTFKLGMKFFGRSKVVSAVQELGWQI